MPNASLPDHLSHIKYAKKFACFLLCSFSLALGRLRLRTKRHILKPDHYVFNAK